MDKTDKLYSRAIVKAHEILNRPAEKRAEDLKKSGWKDNFLPTLDELAPLLIIRAEIEEIQRNIALRKVSRT